MSFQGFLNHLLTSQAGGKPGSSLLNADFGKGAATGGAIPSISPAKAADIARQRVRTVQSRAFASGAVTSLLQRLDLEVTALGLGVDVGAISQAVGLLLTPLGPVLDGVLNSVLALLGLHLGEADVTVHGVSCPRGGAAPPVLVG